MDETPRANRPHLAIFGRRNAGKSSLINALTNQDLALVSAIPGTTTDPVSKAMELLPLGPVVLIDTAGLDDTGELGELRVKRTLRVIRQTDLAVVVLDPCAGVTALETELVARLAREHVPVVAVVNKVDAEPVDGLLAGYGEALGMPVLPVSAHAGTGLEALKTRLTEVARQGAPEPTILGDLIQPGDTVVLVVPIDLAMPKGRLILPQVQTLRDILDHDGIALVVKERELREALGRLSTPPKLVVTDSQAFNKVAADVPPGVPLTGFSILFARHKGDLELLVAGARAIDDLRPGDRVLIAEACTHHRQADDIATVQIPRWLRQYVGGELDFTWKSGHGFPEDLSSYRLVVHCGGCMLNRREMLRRLDEVGGADVPVVNYGVLLAKVHGVLERALEPFPLARLVLEQGF